MNVYCEYDKPLWRVYWTWSEYAPRKIDYFKGNKFKYDPTTKTWNLIYTGDGIRSKYDPETDSWKRVEPIDDIPEAIRYCKFPVLMRDKNGAWKPLNAGNLLGVSKSSPVEIEKEGVFAKITIPCYMLKKSKIPEKIKDYWIYGVSQNEDLTWKAFIETLSNNQEGQAYWKDIYEKDLPEIPTVALMEKRMFKHQREGVRFLMNRKRAILADDMGLGKTYQTLLAAEALFYEGRVLKMLIVCPPTLIGNWKEEIKKWDNPVPFEIVPYSLVHKYEGPIREKTLVIMDEAHYIKNATSRRTTSCFNLFKGNRNISYMWLLTGTPVTKDNSDLFPLAYINDFPWVYTYTPMRMASMRGSNNVILNGLFAPFMLIRKKEDVLDLPEKLTQSIEVRTNIEPDYSILSSGSTALIMEHLMKIKRMCAEVKAKETALFAKEILEGGKKVVIFSDHTKVLDDLQEKLGKWVVVRIDGKTPVKSRQDVVNQFQTDKRVMVFLGNIKAAGVGITLTASSTVIFNDLTWLPSDISQASCRVHRIGQHGTVNIYYLIDKKLVTDVIMSKILFRRSEEIASFEGCKNIIMQELKAFIGKGEE